MKRVRVNKNRSVTLAECIHLLELENIKTERLTADVDRLTQSHLNHNNEIDSIRDDVNYYKDRLRELTDGEDVYTYQEAEDMITETLIEEGDHLRLEWERVDNNTVHTRNYYEICVQSKLRSPLKVNKV